MRDVKSVSFLRLPGATSYDNVFQISIHPFENSVDPGQLASDDHDLH